MESFFSKLEKRLKGLDRHKDRVKYIETAKENAKEIREKVLKYLMVRRTRAEIENYFDKDLKNQNLKFPKVEDPEPVFYELNKEEDEIFNETMELITKKFRYARYMPLLYYKGKLTQPEEISQRNMGRFMKILLIKRLESSFYAFRKSIELFVIYYEKFLNELENGNVYVSKKYTYKIFELLENDDEQKIQDLIDQDKAKKYPAKDFRKELKEDLIKDLETLKEIQKLWQNIKRDPKLLKFIKMLGSHQILKKHRLIVFSESKETVDYLNKNIDKEFPNQVLSFTGGSSATTREKVIENFDAKARFPKNDYRILISTEILSEGVNLHRSDVVINYDIPWNPTRLMQRVGRINRVDTDFDTIYSFNFFPTTQSNVQIKLKEAAEAKIRAFISLLGADARLLTEGEPIESHELFDRLTSKKTITGEDEKEESELKYLRAIKDIRDSNPDLFARIKQLPKKARTSRKANKQVNSLLTYFRKGKLQKFFIVAKEKPQELDFMSAAKMLETSQNAKRENLGKDFYLLLDKNKRAFESATIEEMPELKMAGGRDTATQLLKILKAVRDVRKFTDDQELYLKKVMKEVEEGGLPKQTSKKTLQELGKEIKKEFNPLKILAVLQKNIPSDLLKAHIAEILPAATVAAQAGSAQTSGPREVILSEYFLND